MTSTSLPVIFQNVAADASAQCGRLVIVGDISVFTAERLKGPAEAFLAGQLEPFQGKAKIGPAAGAANYAKASMIAANSGWARPFIELPPRPETAAVSSSFSCP